MPDMRVQLDTGVVTISAPNEIRILVEDARAVLDRLEAADTAGNDEARRRELELLIAMLKHTYSKMGRPKKERPKPQVVVEYATRHGEPAARRKFPELKEATFDKYLRAAKLVG